MVSHADASAESTPTAERRVTADSGSESIRVQVGLLDNLMNTVGELVLIRNQLLQYTDRHGEQQEFVNLSQRLNIVTTELQNEVMKTRMQPVGNVLTKFQRVVRDLARELGKEVDLVIEGKDTELDKTLIEAVKDPLTHIVRNSVDHGLETPDEREAAGKSRRGTIHIRSYHEGGQVVVEVSDDGRGLSPERIGRKAQEKGVISEAALARMTDREIQNLVFAPGFSTAPKVSNISGRGVGMDVVKNNIDKIGGVIELTSTPGKGTSLSLKIPLTLAIVPALIVRSRDERFAIPQVKLEELVRVGREDTMHGRGVEFLQGQPVFRLRGRLLPLVSLSVLLGLETEAEMLEGCTQRDEVNIVILNADSGYFGLIVDAIDDSTDIVVKPLSSTLKRLGMFSGATVMGDGTVALVLDVLGVAQHIHLFDDTQGDLARHAEQAEAHLSDVSDYLVVDIGTSSSFAIPLCLIRRLEEFTLESIEMSGLQRVVRYRGSILPLVNVAAFLGLAGQPDEENAPRDPQALSQVIVIERDNRLFGLEVRRIVDVIAEASRIDTLLLDRPGILGNLIHRDEVVVILDTSRIIDETFALREHHEVNRGLAVNKARARHAISLVEDNAFFRRHVAQILEKAGYQVETHADGSQALTALERKNKGEISVVVSDIEMPHMDGFELAAQLRQLVGFRETPLIALTTRVRDADRRRGLEVGFNQYLEKLDPDVLLAAIDASLNVGGKAA